ncbi:AAA family ATPase [Blastococcus saxobsidens]|uniref:Putative kinase n=1 Tax=Blastococcus saxobsidens TaxID=138336 RepID=A0A4Q7Y4C7_9ACTN|nr:AAA family ATPase [Blastococcus saxobsidens]RZU30679.1 putative kinase [Blastococcus saxobsidens]
MLIVVSGLPGVGKSAVAAELAARLAATWISVDPIEDALLRAGLPPAWETGVAAYEAAGAVAVQNLLAGRVVVADAVNDSEPARQTWRSASVEADAEVRFVLLTLDDDGEHRRRLEGRTRGFTRVPEPSWDDVVARAGSYAPWAEGTCARIDAGRPLDAVVLDIRRGLSGP